jgi:tetratricopeptide (TPR) repeat protein
MRGRPVALLLALCLALSASTAAADLEEARSLKNQGKLEEAARAYREVLAADPDHPDALRELAQVTSWLGRYQEAIEVYLRALEQDSDDGESLLGLARTYSWASEYARSLETYDRYLENHPGETAIRMERARVQSWAGDYRGAIEAYEEHLERRPEDQETRLELAKVLSWSGRLDRSIRTYREILEAEPDNLEAQVGLARTLSWSGDLADADARYDAILAGHPEEVGAMLGKAQLAMWRGERRHGYRLLEELDAVAPGNPEVEQYRAELRRDQNPVVEASTDQIQDSDGNDTEVYRLSLTGHLTPYTTLAGLLRRTDTEFQGREATVDFVGLRLGLSLPRRVELYLTGGVDFVDDSYDESTSRLVATAAAYGPIKGTWRWNAAIGHRTFDSLREVVDNGITYDSITGGADGLWGDWRLGAAGGLTDFSDDNQRLQGTLYATYPWDLPGDFHLETGYRFRWMQYDDNLDNGYFDPQDFYANVLVFTARGPLFTPRADWAVRLEGGVQSFEFDDNTVEDDDGGIVLLEGGEQDNDTLFGWEVRLGVDLTRRTRLEAYYGETDYAAQSASGFDSEHWGVVFRHRF